MKKQIESIDFTALDVIYPLIPDIVMKDIKRKMDIFGNNVENRAETNIGKYKSNIDFLICKYAHFSLGYKLFMEFISSEDADGMVRHMILNQLLHDYDVLEDELSSIAAIIIDLQEKILKHIEENKDKYGLLEIIYKEG